MNYCPISGQALLIRDAIIWRILSAGLWSSNGPSPFLMKDYYADASQRFHTTPDSIQQSIRTFLKNYWMLENGKHFQKVTGYRGAVPIPPKDFITVLVDYLLRNSARI